MASTQSGFATIDRDGDGVSDVWQQIHPALNPSDDSDLDGFSNALEAVAGTDPSNRESHPKISSISVDSTGGKVTVSWSTVAGKCYDVEKFDTATGIWTSMLSMVATESGAHQEELPFHFGCVNLTLLKISRYRRGR